MNSALQLSPAPAPAADLRAVASVPWSLRDSIDYALERQGGGFRWKLAQATGAACGLDARSSALLGEGLECFHDASLIFDDLPCMDDAEERRGRRCLHRVAGESKAILSALALVNRAYTLSWKVASQAPLHSGLGARAVERCIGELGILDGQDRDLCYRAALGAKEVKAIAARKTGALLQLTLLLPAILGGVSFGEMLHLSRTARAWGIAYQALDDFSDLLPSLGQTDKTPFQDLRRNRPNLVVALGQVEASAELRRYLAQAERQIAELVLTDAKWAFLSDFHAVLAGKEAALRSALRVA